MTRPGVTVVTPFHAQRRTNGMLERAAASVRAQTVPVHHICAEDIHHLGAAITRTHGLALVETEWTAFLDSDDEMDPDHIEQLLACQQETGADYVYPWFRVVGGTDPFPMFYGKPFEPAAPNSTTITILVRTELAQQVGFHPDPNVQVGGEDYQFTLSCIAAGAHIVHLPRRSWTWHHHGGGNTSGRPDRGDARPGSRRPRHR
ncbi:glycosyltransferase family A protein [Streptomyces sp. ME08-AFT2]|uniref:glycosyltransferase family 2 protein n=1 Tax=Streptomyces sp. ME08-AFT2 TaxID=3028683 RepID=UPI0029A0D003|nr:glycosyltransferase family A protein [Streptomyces sp. ME08-AFT2]MDX3314647.1 glycosyltransferase family A protein [Streptomyces sp. ME08-AFT2]